MGGTCSVYCIIRTAWIVLTGNFGIEEAYMNRM